jgi:hypothetical protein
MDVRTPHKRYRLGLVTQLIILVAIVTMVIGGILGIVLTNTSANTLKQDVLRNNLAQADLAAQFASNYVKAVQASARSFASRPSVVQAELADTPEKLQLELSQYLQIQVALDSISVYDTQGIQRASGVTNATTIGQSFADREWFQQAVATLQPYGGIPVKSRTTGKPVCCTYIGRTGATSRLGNLWYFPGYAVRCHRKHKLWCWYTSVS